MSTTKLPVFANTLRKTEDWLEEIMELLEWSDQKRAYKALRVVLHTLRDRLTIEEATDLAAQLPMLIRGMYYEGWNPTGKPTKLRNAEEFVAIVNKTFPDGEFAEDVDPEDVTRVVLKVLASRVSTGEIDDVIHSLPEGLRGLWV